MAPTIPNFMLSSSGNPARKAPWWLSLNGPRKASRISSESSNTRHLISGFHCQRIFRHLWADAHPSPYINIVGSTDVAALRISFIVSMSWIPIRSKRNPSMWYSLIQCNTDSIMFTHHRTVAGSFIATAEPSAYVPSVADGKSIPALYVQNYCRMYWKYGYTPHPEQHGYLLCCAKPAPSAWIPGYEHPVCRGR